MILGVIGSILLYINELLTGSEELADGKQPAEEKYKREKKAEEDRLRRIAEEEGTYDYFE